MAFLINFLKVVVLLFLADTRVAYKEIPLFT
jgi:hypothetical protein